MHYELKIENLPSLDEIGPVSHELYRHGDLLIGLIHESTNYARWVEAPPEDELQLLPVPRPQPLGYSKKDGPVWDMRHLVPVHMGTHALQGACHYFGRASKHLSEGITKKRHQKKDGRRNYELRIFFIDTYVGILRAKVHDICNWSKRFLRKIWIRDVLILSSCMGCQYI